MEERQIDVSNMTIDEAVRELLFHEEYGEHVYCRIHGHIFHSNNVTVDNVYRTLTGHSREETRKNEAKKLYTARLEKMKMEGKIPGWIAKGKKMIYEENYTAWEFCVSKLVSSSFNSKPIEMALEIMEALYKGDKLGNVVKLLNSDNPRINNLVESIVFSYSMRGPEFKEYLHKDNLTAEDMVLIDKQKKKNAEYKKAARARFNFKV